MSLVLAIDVGTTAVKGAVFDLVGEMRACCSEEYALETPGPEIVELDPEVYWRAARAVIARALAAPGVDPKAVVSVGVTSQGETLIVLDRDGRPLRKAIVWLDNRATDEAAAIEAAFGRDDVYTVTGQQEIVPCWTACKILWLRRHEPAAFAAAARFLLPADYIVYRLTGRFATDHGLNPSTLYYDLRNGRWWEPMLDYLGITAGQLPELLPSGAAAGTVTAEVGLPAAATVRVAPIDQVAAAVGAGNLEPGAVTETTGSALALCATVDRPVCDARRRVGLYRHALPGLYVLLPWIPTAGMILRWFRDEFAGGADYAALDRAAAAVPPGSDGLLLLPHFSGMVSPEVNPAAKGVLYGLSLSHGRGHVARAIMEAVAFALRDNLAALGELGIDYRRLIALGGGANSATWLQIKADALQQPVEVMACAETTSLGTAMLAAAGAGLFAGAAEAAAAMARRRAVIAPDPANRAVYDDAFARYKEMERKLFLA